MGYNSTSRPYHSLTQKVKGSALSCKDNCRALPLGWAIFCRTEGNQAIQRRRGHDRSSQGLKSDRFFELSILEQAPGHFGKFPERKSSSMPTIRSTCVMNWSCTRTLFSIFFLSARLIGTSNSFRLVSPVLESGFCITCGKPERGLPELSRTFTERAPVSLSFRRLIFTEN